MPTNPSPSASVSAFATLNSIAARTADGRTLFDNLTLAFGRERTGVVGANGVGKSTLLRLVAGDLAPAEGVVTRSGAIGVLSQRHDPAPDETAAATLGAAPGLAVIARILAGEGSADDLAEADWTLEARALEALDAVGLAGMPFDRPTQALSGGEQTRLRLARLMLDRPDLILLDEPTNHLDIGARRLVADVLDRWQGGAVVVSHDRALLRRMDRIIEISGVGVQIYGGGYDLYVEQQRLEREAAARALASAERHVVRVGADAQRRLEAKSRRDAAGRRKAARGDMPRILLSARAERAENSGGADTTLASRQAEQAKEALSAVKDRVERRRALLIPMPTTGLAAGRTVLALSEATVDAPDGRRIVGPISLTLTGPERLAITGPNGAGKTTLLRLITGALEAATGQVERPVAAALLDQEAAILRPDETLLEAWRRLNPHGSPNAAQAALARFLFRNAAAQRLVGDLSGGERLRAALACVMGAAAPPQLLVLDEPTNHLDLDAVAAVETALQAYDGALVVVSHDEDFLKAVGINRVLAL